MNIQATKTTVPCSNPHTTLWQPLSAITTNRPVKNKPRVIRYCHGSILVSTSSVFTHITWCFCVWVISTSELSRAWQTTQPCPYGLSTRAASAQPDMEQERRSWISWRGQCRLYASEAWQSVLFCWLSASRLEDQKNYNTIWSLAKMTKIFQESWLRTYIRTISWIKLTTDKKKVSQSSPCCKKKKKQFFTLPFMDN